MTPITKYLSFDGIEFPDADACRRHEAENFAARLVGLTAEQVAAALTREDPELAEGFETAGKVIRELRIKAGDLKRARNGEGLRKGAAPPLAIEGPRADAPCDTEQAEPTDEAA